MNDRWDEPLFLDEFDPAPETDEPARFWTARRVLYALVALLVILALLAYLLWPLLLALTQPAPAPQPPLPFNVV